jgi:hypothetical protein
MSDEAQERKEMGLKILVWAIPVVFGAGALVQTVRSDDASLANLQDEVTEQTEDLDAHKILPGHPVSTTQIEHLAEQQGQMIVEQRAMRVTQGDMAMDLAAICQATGADCGRN